MNIEEGKVYLSRSNKIRSVHVKEITYYAGASHVPAYVVCGDECDFKSDSKTNVSRQVILATEFCRLYCEEPVKEDDWSFVGSFPKSQVWSVSYAELIRKLQRKILDDLEKIETPVIEIYAMKVTDVTKEHFKKAIIHRFGFDAGKGDEE